MVHRSRQADGARTILLSSVAARCGGRGGGIGPKGLGVRAAKFFTLAWKDVFRRGAGCQNAHRSQKRGAEFEFHVNPLKGLL